MAKQETKSQAKKSEKLPYKAVIFDYDGVLTTRLSDMLMPHKYPFKKSIFGFLCNGDMVRLVQRLKAEGYRVILLSNTFFPLAWFRGKLGYYKEFEEVFLSYQTGYRKPNAKAYTSLLEKCGLKPADALFIDDRGRNTDRAQELGIDSIQSKNFLQTYADICEKTGLKP